MPEQVILDENGFPVLLAEVPNAGVARLDPDAAGGNDAHDVRSGKFAPKPDKPRGPAPPPNMDPIEFKRMLDAVRDAAREFDFPEEGDIREFLQGRAKNPAQVDVQNFLLMVREQIKTDIVDVLDNQLRRGGSLTRGRRTVRVQAPRGYTNRTLRGLSADEIAEVMHRLEARGHEREQIDKFFDKRVKEDTAAEGKQKRDAVAASAQWDIPVLEEGDLFSAENELEFAVEMAERIARNIQPPVVNVHPQIIVEK